MKPIPKVLSRIVRAVLTSGLVLGAALATSAQAERVCRTVYDGMNKYGGVQSHEECKDVYQIPSNPNAGGQGGGRSYGAIATASGGASYGYSYRWNTQAEAERAALSDCDKEAGRRGACKVATWFYNQCGALAVGDNGAWATDWAGSIRAARAKALSDCQKSDPKGQCKVEVSYCSP